MCKLVLFIFLYIPAAALAQRSISEIKIEGLTRTKEDYLRLFISSQVGDQYDSLKIEADRQRIANLEIMGTVVVDQSKTLDGITIVFRCSEMFNTIPIFALGKTDETFWCRAGVQDANIGGKGNKLIAYYQYYDRHSIFLNYQLTRFGNKPWSYSANFTRWATVEPLTINETIVDYNYDNLTGGVSVTRHFGFRESVEISVGGFQELYTKQQDTQDLQAIDELQRRGGLIKSIFRSNHLNYSSFYLQGFSTQLNSEVIKRTVDPTLFFIVFNDFKYFHRIGKTGNLATRLKLGLSTNEDTPFAPFVLDSYLNIRGVGNRVDRGTGTIVTNIEYRQTFIDKRLFAAQAVAFFDFGTWRKPGGDFSDFAKTENMKAFGGMGLRAIYKRAFDTMLRIDYGYNYNKTGGFVVGIGQYF